MEGRKRTDRRLIPKITILFFVAGLCLQFQSKAEEAGDHQVTGTFTVDGKATYLKYVYTWCDTSLFDSTQKDLMLLFSDKPVPEGADIPFDLGELGKKSKIRAIEVRYSKEEECIIGGTLYHKGMGDMMVTFSGKFRVKSELLTLTDSLVEGKIFTEEPQESFDDHTWEVMAEFKTTFKKEE